PGLVVIKYRRGSDTGKFGNVAVVRGDQVREVDERSARLPDAPALLAALLGYDELPLSWADARNELVQLAVSMRGHGRGGVVVLGTGRSGAWVGSVARP